MSRCCPARTANLVDKLAAARRWRPAGSGGLVAAGRAAGRVAAAAAGTRSDAGAEAPRRRLPLISPEPRR